MAAGRLTRLGAFHPSPGFCDELMAFYRMEELTPLAEAVARDEDERIEARTFTAGPSTCCAGA